MKIEKLEIDQIINSFKYCPNCGFQFDDYEDHSKICPNCDLHFYINPSPTTGAVLLNEKGEILLVKRRVDPGKGLWDIPGGFVDLNEDLETSLKRELKEELNIKIDDLKYLTSKVDTYKYGNRLQQTLGVIFEGKVLQEDKIIPSDDVDGFDFFTKDNFPIDKISFKSLEDFFREYLKLEN